MNFRCRTHGADNMIRYKYIFFEHIQRRMQPNMRGRGPSLTLYVARNQKDLLLGPVVLILGLLRF